MPGSATSVFSEAQEFEATLREGGCRGLLVTGLGKFRARLTRIKLHGLCLSAAEERLSRIIFLAVAPATILVALPGTGDPAPVLGGIRMGPREIVTVGPGERLHMRSHGPHRWGAIWLPVSELVRSGSALTGAAFAVPSTAGLWRPRPATCRHLRHLHSVAIRLAERGSFALVDGAAAHGLEQQLIETLVECLSTDSAIDTSPVTHERQDVALRFEALLQTQPERAFRTAEICSALGVSAQTLRLSCEEQIGVGPVEYVRRRRMQLAYRALRYGNPDMASVSAIAGRCGFRTLGRFAANFRALYGELPSAILRRGPEGVAPLALRRSKATVSRSR
jgi:AraC-like DNA-binding protein